MPVPKITGWLLVVLMDIVPALFMSRVEAEVMVEAEVKFSPVSVI